MIWWKMAVVGEAYRDVLIDGFVPPSSVAPMFPFYDDTSEWDDFGEVINPDDYVIKDEDMDMGSMAVSSFWIFLNFEYWILSESESESVCVFRWVEMLMENLMKALLVWCLTQPHQKLYLLNLL